VSANATILDRILATKRAEVAARARTVPLEKLSEAVRRAPACRGFLAALSRRDRESPTLIAEVKKASPSRGVIRADFDPVAIAKSYERGGAAAVSVLTDATYFQGSLEDLSAVHDAIQLPVLRKDFVIDPYQVWEARAAGADAILLIVAALPHDDAAQELDRQARDLGLDVLWEVHDRQELDRLLRFQPRAVGINNRDLKTFEVSLETTIRLAPEIPAGVLKVSESGFSRREELDRLRAVGVDAFLVGETLMRAKDPGAALAELLGPQPEGKP